MYKFVIVQSSKVALVNCFRFALSLTSGISSFNTSPIVQLMMQAEFIKYDSDRLGVNFLCQFWTLCYNWRLLCYVKVTMCHFPLSYRLHQKTPTLCHQLIKGERPWSKPQNHNGLRGNSHEENAEMWLWFIILKPTSSFKHQWTPVHFLVRNIYSNLESSIMLCCAVYQVLELSPCSNGCESLKVCL